MNKRPDQHNIDPDEARATDYKSRRQTEDRARRVNTDTEGERANRATTQTPNEAMETRRQQSQSDRERELERAAEVKERQPNQDAQRDTAARMGRGSGELNVSSGTARGERADREQRDREELGRQSLETQGRSMEDAVEQRREREARENERR